MQPGFLPDVQGICFPVNVFISDSDLPDNLTNFTIYTSKCAVDDGWLVLLCVLDSTAPTIYIFMQENRPDAVQFHIHTQVLLLGPPDGFHSVNL